MKWNISKIKHHNYDIKPASVLDSFGVDSWKHVILGDFFANKWWSLLQEFPILPPENDVLQKVLTHKRS